MMQSNINEIVFRLLRKHALADTSMQQLEELVHDFPYFSLCRYLLARKAMETNAANKTALAQDLALYVPNTYWLNYILTEDLKVTVSKESVTPVREEALTTDNDAQLASITPIHEKVDASAPHAPATEPTEQEQQQEQANLENISHTLSKIKLEASTITGTEAMPLDPYHRIDYFASQGIRLEKDELANDQVGKKLKKFTEWLKTMKRIPENEASAEIDDNTSRNIQNLAARSLLGTEILTEAMAEVYTKQKLYNKAISLYKKLSLQNPAKSTYFASRIEELNKFAS